MLSWLPAVVVARVNGHRAMCAASEDQKLFDGTEREAACEKCVDARCENGDVNRSTVGVSEVVTIDQRLKLGEPCRRARKLKAKLDVIFIHDK